MSYKLSEVNYRAKHDPQGFIKECDALYNKNIEDVAQVMTDNVERAPIILLSGPSGSGKTTTAKKIEMRLREHGVVAHTISMDNYFKDVNPIETPKDSDGDYDFESPECLDIELLNEHFKLLYSHKEVELPMFDFPNQKQVRKTGKMLKLGKNDVAIFEGIHALNDKITGPLGDHALKIYISAMSDVIDDNGEIVLMGKWIRLLRRMHRDYLFRGASPEYTMHLWDGVRAGEGKYVSPFKNEADIKFNTAVPYEVPVLKSKVLNMVKDIPKHLERYDELIQIYPQLLKFEEIDSDLVPEDSLIREFIGGGIF